MTATTLPWQDPMECARFAAAHHEQIVFLHSALDVGYSGQASLLALNPKRIATGDSFDALPASNHQSGLEHGWFGYLGYELLHGLEHVPAQPPSPVSLPRLWMAQFETVVRFDHARRAVEIFGKNVPLQSMSTTPLMHSKPPALHSNMSKAEYLERVEQLKEAIMAGELYQANLTRKFYGTFDSEPDSFELFAQLCAHSPSPYSAFIKTGEAAIISSSPERFLKAGADGHAEMRPIKGSAPRGQDAASDEAAKKALLANEKERAENLMIVDLIRNDLSRAAKTGSVKVDSLYDISTYATVHHMSSTVSAQKRDDVTTPDLIKACFPPGSMTGAPKIRAMEWCGKLEGTERGVYSGALGWLGADGACDLSVVIRTLILKGRQFEFQVGGGIVADSVPGLEWEETLLKAGAIARTLGITQEILCNI